MTTITRSLPATWKEWKLFPPCEDSKDRKNDTNSKWTRAKAGRVVQHLNKALLDVADGLKELHEELGEIKDVDETIDNDMVYEVLDSASELTDDAESGLHDSEPMDVAREWLTEFVEKLNSSN